MTVRLSRDDGRTWPAGPVPWPGPTACCCLGSLPDGTILCLDERGDRDAHEKITLARLTLDWLEQQGSRGLWWVASEETLRPWAEVRA